MTLIRAPAVCFFNSFILPRFQEAFVTRRIDMHYYYAYGRLTFRAKAASEWLAVGRK